MADRDGLTDAELGAIVVRSQTLAERVQDAAAFPPGHSPRAAQRLAHWQQVAAKNDPAAFGAVLASMGLENASESQLLALLGEAPRPPDGFALPRWAILLQDMTQATAAAFRENRRPRPPRGARRIPFADLYAPLAALARSRVQSIAPLLLDAAWAGLERHLLNRLAAVCSLALQPAFLAFKAVRQAAMPWHLFVDKPVNAPSKRPLYDAFIREQGANGLTSFFLEYPVAARLAARVTQNWIDAAREFLRRLETDRAALATHFFAGKEPGKVVSIGAGISDPHRGGRSVLVVYFERGNALLYKPRAMQLDAAFFALLAGFRQLKFRVLKVLPRDGYGWEEFVRPAACNTPVEARRFYCRAGVLMGLVHRLGGVDIHCENLIAAGEHAVIVDLEALCHPLAEPAVPGEGGPGDPSVVRTGMLPAARRPFDNSALAAPVRQRSTLPGVRWAHVNRDAMEISWGVRSAYFDAHRPRLGHRLLFARDYLEDLEWGFARGVRWIASGLGEWALTESRVIRRATMVYAALMRHASRPPFLKDGVDRSIELQALPLLGENGDERNAELAAMENLDVPYFTRRATLPERAAFTQLDLDAEIRLVRAAIRPRRRV